MISSAKFSRAQKTAVAVEHPDEWDEKQIRTAACARMMDLSSVASWYDGPSRTKLDGIDLGADPAEDADDAEEGEDMPTRYHPDPVVLTEEDLADGEAMMSGEEPTAEASAKVEPPVVAAAEHQAEE